MKKLKIKTSKKEIIDITKAWVAISIAFAFVLRDPSTSLVKSLFISSIAVGFGFLLHELAHKVVAQRYGCWAEFRSWDIMLVFAIVLSYFTKWVFAAPGAVFISGFVGIPRNGRISVAGPITNLVLAVFFLILLIISSNSLVITIAQYGISVNTWLAIFNMLPFGPLDGKKVLAWNKTVYFTVLGIAILMMFGLNALASILL
ncbi:site-2 protease family protein [Candidatus Woesearchaeota archaeon]|nr:site-2 protease family protein [Candidatus Woesearchaeota archaeon]